MDCVAAQVLVAMQSISYENLTGKESSDTIPNLVLIPADWTSSDLTDFEGRRVCMMNSWAEGLLL